MLKQNGLYVTPKEVAQDYLKIALGRDLDGGLAEVLDSNPTRKERLKIQDQLDKLRLRAVRAISGAGKPQIIKTWEE